MSIKRYDPFKDEKGFGMKEALCGDYVKYSDFLAERERCAKISATIREAQPECTSETDSDNTGGPDAA